MEVKIFETIKDIDRCQWDSIVGNDNIQVSYDYLKAVEESTISDYSYYYILIYDGNELVAAMPAFITSEFCLDTPLVGSIKKRCEAIRRILPRFMKRKVLFCGCCIAEYNTFNIKDGVEYRQVVDLFLSEVKKLSKAKKAKLIIFKDFVEVHPGVQEILKKNKYFDTYSLPTTCVETNYDSFENYLEKLKKKYRQNIRNKINKSCKCGLVEYEVLDSYDSIAEDLFSLYKNTYSKAPVKFEMLGKEFFLNTSEYMKGKTSVIIAKKDDKIIGFMLLVNSEDSCVNVRMGMDYKYAHEHHLYYMLLFKNIDYAIERNLKKLYLSQTTYRPKLELGAQLMPLFGFVKHRNPIMNIIFKFIFNILFKKYRILANSKNPHEKLKLLFPHYFNNTISSRKIGA